MITSATITCHGDPSVGIPDHQIEVAHLDFDPSLFAEEDREDAVEALRKSLAMVGRSVSGEDSVSVFLHGLDENDEEWDPDDYDDSMDGDHESALASCGLGVDEDYGSFDEPADWD